MSWRVPSDWWGMFPLLWKLTTQRADPDSKLTVVAWPADWNRFQLPRNVR